MSDELVTIYQSSGANVGEMEAQEIQRLLEASGIASVLVGDAVLPNLGFEVRVQEADAAQANRIIFDALETGPGGAEEAERSSESGESEA